MPGKPRSPPLNETSDEALALAIDRGPLLAAQRPLLRDAEQIRSMSSKPSARASAITHLWIARLSGPVRGGVSLTSHHGGRAGSFLWWLSSAHGRPRTAAMGCRRLG